MTEKYNIPEKHSLDFMEGLRESGESAVDSKVVTIDNHIQNSEEKVVETKIVENEELGVSFEDKIIELPKYRQIETGIKRIRRRVLTRLPDFIFNGDGYQYGKVAMSKDVAEIWDFITDYKICSGTKFSHVVARRFNNPDEGPLLNQHTTEGFYFGKILPPNKWDHDKEIIDGIEISDLFTCVGNSIWTNNISTPVYFFGTENSAFKKYLESILNNTKILECLKKRWIKSLGGDIEIVYPGSVEFDEEYEKLVKEYSDPVYEYDFITDIKKQKKICEEKNIPIIKGFRYANINFLEILSKGINTTSLDFQEFTIPAVNSKEIKPLRWCHSDLAIIPTKKSLNILFFES